jgi:D-alanyl-D-alanine dipeptidase
VDQFAAWTKDAANSKMKSIYYPEEAKATLFERGYIDAKSGHSRGSTVDLTLIRKNEKSDAPLAYKENITDCRKTNGIEKTGQLDMGTTFDCFSELANTANPGVSKEALANREILKAAMEKAGFRNYQKEWWHYTLKQEPYTKDYFDFEVN